MKTTQSGDLSPRERVMKSIRHEEPDRVPLFFTITPQVAEQAAKRLGIPRYTLADSPLSQNRISYSEILTELGNDIVGIGACAPTAFPTREVGQGLIFNEWQTKYRSVGLYSEMVENPLAGAEKVSDVENFPFPDPLAPGRYTLAKEVAERYGERYAICGDLECTIFEASWYLTGLEKFLLDLTLEKEYIFALLDRVMAYSIGVGVELAKIGADIIWLGDDMGSQQGMLISPEMWRTHFKERMRTVISSIRKVNPEVKIAYHCCGSYEPIMGDLIEVGVDILNALQPTARDMDTAMIKARYGRKATLFGALDTQDALPFGTMAQVEAEILRVLRAAGKGGGLILAGAHNLQPDVSTDKLLRIFEFSKEHGTYPIR